MGDLLSRFLRDSDAADADGPHVVIARGAIDRYFGPFATRYHALAAAAAEDAEWQREFPGAQVTFDIAPLASTNCLAEF
ncbi:MAG: hypothetical protein NTX33_01650 [Propionibacteriales bacterium]|nr:hypothetical protein [Propionibacteriales bacterium]